jgi:hypothetical protein
MDPRRQPQFLLRAQLPPRRSAAAQNLPGARLLPLRQLAAGAPGRRTQSEKSQLACAALRARPLRGGTGTPFHNACAAGVPVSPVHARTQDAAPSPAESSGRWHALLHPARDEVRAHLPSDGDFGATVQRLPGDGTGAWLRLSCGSSWRKPRHRTLKLPQRQPVQTRELQPGT